MLVGSAIARNEVDQLGQLGARVARALLALELDELEHRVQACLLAGELTILGDPGTRCARVIVGEALRQTDEEERCLMLRLLPRCLQACDDLQ